MKSYIVNITETLELQVEAEADHADEAEMIVSDKWRNGEYILGSDTFTGVKFKAIPVNPVKEKVIRFIFTAAREIDCQRLHLIKHDGKYTPWVVCWNFDSETTTWDWGTYCSTLKDALAVFIRKLTEHEFDCVDEGYIERRIALNG